MSVANKYVKWEVTHLFLIIIMMINQLDLKYWKKKNYRRINLLLNLKFLWIVKKWHKICLNFKIDYFLKKIK